MKPLAVLLLSATLGLGAQEDPGNRMGIGLAMLSPIDTWGSSFNTGFQAGLQVYFNRESRHLGRLRIDYLQADSKGPIQTGLYDVWDGNSYALAPRFATSRMEAYSVAYEWLPHVEESGRHGLFGIFGMGGTLWNQTLRPTASSGGGSYTETDLGFTLSAGVGWRFNPHASLEVRLTHTDISFREHPNYGSSWSYLTFGTGLRF
jgi:hypothetical protein